MAHDHHDSEQPELLNFLISVSQQLEFLLQNRGDEDEAFEIGADFIDSKALNRQLVYQQQQHQQKMNIIAGITPHNSCYQRPSPVGVKVHNLIDHSHDQVQQTASVATHPFNQVHYSYHLSVEPQRLHCSAEQQSLIQDANYATTRDGSSSMIPQVSSMDASYLIPPLSARIDYQTTDCAYCCWLATTSLSSELTTTSINPLEPICYSTSATYDHDHGHHHSSTTSTSYNHIHYSR